VKTPTITPIVAALEHDGLLARDTDATDGRASILRATPKGMKLASFAEVCSHRSGSNRSGSANPARWNWG
jgi:hypothetical protein